MDHTDVPTRDRGIALSGLTKSYGPVRALRGVNLRIAPGETVALLGPNGAGKSTAIDILLGLTRPDAGAVSLFGMTPDEATRSGAVAAMLQTCSLIRELTVRELIGMVASLYPRPLGVDEVLTLTGTTEYADRRTHRLSGGQTQRVRFALALVADPDLLVLDEPTAALDVEARREFWSIMRSFTSRGKTILFATHYLEEADEYADRIVLLARGRVVADGAASQVKALVSGKTVRTTLPGVKLAALAGLPGVTSAERHGEMAVLSCSDSDTTLRALLPRYPEAHDIEVRGAGLEEAFLELTATNP